LGERGAQVLEHRAEFGGVHGDVVKWAGAVSEQLADGENCGGVGVVGVLEQCGGLEELATDGGGAITQHWAGGLAAARWLGRIGGLAQRMRERAAGTRSGETDLSPPREPAPE
jgi:hypothetical protein